jgi:hypothetical protein
MLQSVKTVAENRRPDFVSLKAKIFSFFDIVQLWATPSFLSSGHEMHVSPAVKQTESEIKSLLFLGPRLRKHGDLLQYLLYTFMA